MFKYKNMNKTSRNCCATVVRPRGIPLKQTPAATPFIMHMGLISHQN